MARKKQVAKKRKVSDIDKDDVPRPQKGLTDKEERTVEETLPMRAAVIYEIIRVEGEGELARKAQALWWSGVAAGWLIAALVWMLPSAKEAEFLVITFLTYLIALGGFTLVIAGSAEAFYGWLTGVSSIFVAVSIFLVPTLAGNVIGGTVPFAVLSYAQVRQEIQSDK